MQPKGIFYNAVKQLGRSVGTAEKTLVGSRNVVFRPKTVLDAESIRVEILKEKKEGELTILSIDKLQRLFSRGSL